MPYVVGSAQTRPKRRARRNLDALGELDSAGSVHQGGYMNGKERGSSDVGPLVGLSVVAWGVAAWITHVVVCLKAASWGFLIAGAILFPIALIHGTGLWFGWF